MVERIALPDIVVLLPGITGSVLVDGDGRVVWGYSAATIAKALFTGGETMRKALALPHDDPTRDMLDDGIRATALMPDLHLVPGLWKIDGYAAVADMLLARFDLIESENFFRFPYDWRRDNRVAARLLGRAVHGWLGAWRSGRGGQKAKVMLIAHSMGGLVSRCYLENLEGWKDTRALISFGTPYRGSLNALDGLANGTKKGPLDLSDLMRQFPSVYQLLPTFECWDDGSGKLQPVGKVAGIPNVDSARAAEALRFHDEIAAAVATNHSLDAFHATGYRVHPIVGTAQKTFMSAKADGRGGVALSELHGSATLGGDGTVPRVSAIPHEMSADPTGAVYAATQHGSLQNAEAMLTHLHGLLSGTTIDLGGFRKPKVQVAIELDDVTEAKSPLRVRARPVNPDVKIAAVLRNATGRTVKRAPMHQGAGGWFEADFGPRSAGVYRVRVEGAGIEPAEDSCVVLG